MKKLLLGLGSIAAIAAPVAAVIACGSEDLVSIPVNEKEIQTFIENFSFQECFPSNVGITHRHSSQDGAYTVTFNLKMSKDHSTTFPSFKAGGNSIKISVSDSAGSKHDVVVNGNKLADDDMANSVVKEVMDAFGDEIIKYT